MFHLNYVEWQYVMTRKENLCIHEAETERLVPERTQRFSECFTALKQGPEAGKDCH